MQSESRLFRRHVTLTVGGDPVYVNFHLKWLAGLVLVFSLSSSAFAQGSIDLAWDPSPDISAVGYRVYYRPVGRAETNVIDVKFSTKVHIDVLELRAYEFFVTAYSADGSESDPSNVAIATPAPPKNTRTVLSLAPELITTNLVATPQLRDHTNASAMAPSLAVQLVNRKPVLVIGGEAVETGRWAVAISVDLSTWTELAQGDTPQRIEFDPIGAQAFFRIYSVPINLELALEEALSDVSLPP
jgi:hypothetical protein